MDDRPVGVPVSPDVLRARLASELQAAPLAPEQVIDELVSAVDPGLVASAGPRYFGFVTGQALPAARAADMLAAVWDQNAFSYASSPAAAVVEEVAERWVLDVLGLPATASVGFVTGASMANATCLAAARNVVLGRLGWDAARDGLIGAPALRVLASGEAHATIHGALRFIGLGAGSAELVDVTPQGALDVERLTLDGPAIVCAQAGNVNTGAIDDLALLAEKCRAAGAWLHVDGAFGLWAAASPALRQLVAGAELADSWATDAHKWLNVPYDSGLAIVADRVAHRSAMGLSAAYLIESEHRQNYDYTPEASRRARGFAVYAALRSLGRSGLAQLIDRCCAHARLFATLLSEGGLEVLNDVTLNQVLVAASPEQIARVQEDGTCWLGGTVWRGRSAMRISVSGYGTTEDDVRRSAAAILRATV
ncbi:pyridoxal-dependent decarboxylase [Solirubrobacter phytolaccae]|uniref:Pyridoxal-dependent decarboxylase n=1 Tax=Solirubrobacter phytolaccae TaxID=1404360 RepID=A0A9X3SB75_9ACTN|nr:pyridoxal-dependent decarboxylase [Solirubrobacter phytolaccae]MDA0185299.1 pyridoxal-dependent decarboxylase [Solirubrobacter phytolaccae]